METASIQAAGHIANCSRSQAVGGLHLWTAQMTIDFIPRKDGLLVSVRGMFTEFIHRIQPKSLPGISKSHNMIG